LHFEVTFRSKETYEKHLSYGLVFIPVPVWVKGSEQVLNLNPRTPAYQKGSVNRLIEQEKLNFNENKEAVVAIRDIGHGTRKDFDTLKEDLADSGFKVIVYGEEILENNSF